tara:strand:- start:2475 stop:4208 length:1734 start_codon:yes stop_codon:yes gene_type:complete
MGKLLNKNIIASVKGIGSNFALIPNDTDIEGYIVKQTENKDGYLPHASFTASGAGTNGGTIQLSTGLTAVTLEVQTTSSNNGAAIGGGNTNLSVDSGVDAFSFAQNFKDALPSHWHCQANVRGVGIVDIWNKELIGGDNGNTDITVASNFNDSCSVNPPASFSGGRLLDTTHTGTSVKNRADNEMVSRLAEASEFCREKDVLWQMQKDFKIQSGWFTSGSDRIRLGSIFAVGGDWSDAPGLLLSQFYKNSAKALGTSSPNTKSTASIRMTDSMSENDHIVVRIPYTNSALTKEFAFRGTTSGSNGDSLDGGAAIAVRIETGGTAFSRASDFGDNLKAAMEHANAFGSDISVANDVSSGTYAQITLTDQLDSHKVDEQNSKIIYDGTSYLSSGNYDEAFTPGVSEFDTDEYLYLGNETNIYKLPYITATDNTHIQEILVRIVTDTSINSDQQDIPFRLDAYGGTCKFTSGSSIPDIVDEANKTITSTSAFDTGQLQSASLIALQKLGSSQEIYEDSSWLDGNERAFNFTIPIDKTMQYAGNPVVIIWRWLGDDSDIDHVTTPAISQVYCSASIIGGAG